jgi:hypothetical protein
MHWGIFVAGKMPAWLGDPKLIMVSCVIWGFPWVGSFAVLTYLAKLQSISKDVYEAGEIDGVGWWSKFTKIELPLIMGSIYLLLVFVIIESIKDAGMILALVGVEGGPGGIATVPALFMLRKAFVEQQMGYACAVGIILTVVVMAMQKLSNAVMNWDPCRTRRPAWPCAPCCCCWAAACTRGAPRNSRAWRPSCSCWRCCTRPCGRCCAGPSCAAGGRCPGHGRGDDAVRRAIARENSAFYRKARVVGDFGRCACSSTAPSGACWPSRSCPST